MLKRINIFVAACMLATSLGAASAWAEALTLPQFWSEYFWNRNNAKIKYENKSITIEGVVHMVSTPRQGNPRICLASVDNNVSKDFFWCSFEQSKLNSVAGVRQGQTVRIQGICTFDRQGNVYLTKCTVVN